MKLLSLVFIALVACASQDRKPCEFDGSCDQEILMPKIEKQPEVKKEIKKVKSKKAHK
jgi:hypothetical protein